MSIIILCLCYILVTILKKHSTSWIKKMHHKLPFESRCKPCEFGGPPDGLWWQIWGPSQELQLSRARDQVAHERKIVGLKLLAFGGVGFWGIFMNLTTINIVLGNSYSWTDERKDDAAIGAVILVLLILPVVGAYALSLEFVRKGRNVDWVPQKQIRYWRWDGKRCFR